MSPPLVEKRDEGRAGLRARLSAVLAGSGPSLEPRAGTCWVFNSAIKMRRGPLGQSPEVTHGFVWRRSGPMKTLRGRRYAVGGLCLGSAFM